jgi:hypothetical protein
MKFLPLSLVFFFCLFVPRTEIFGQERADAPLFRDGDRWRYRVAEHGEYMKTERELNGVYELIYTTGRLTVFKVEESQKQELKSGTAVLLGLVAQTKSEQYLLFPLYPGKSWSTDHVLGRDAGTPIASSTP